MMTRKVMVDVFTQATTMDKYYGATHEMIHLAKTTPEFYLSGLAALNLPSPTGSGDWHFASVFSGQGTSRGFYAGAGSDIDNNGLFGQTDIFECSEILTELGLTFDGARAYAARHSRAIADLLADNLTRNRVPSFITLDDWLTDPADLAALSGLIDMLAGKLNTEQTELLEKWKENNPIKPPRNRINI